VSPLAGTPFFNLPHYVLQQSLLAPIREHSHTTGYTPTSSSTPYGHPEGDPPPKDPPVASLREAPSTFMEPLTHLMHHRLEAPCTPSCSEGPMWFRVPYPIANPLTTPTMFIHSPNPHLITVDHPLTPAVRELTSAEKDYVHTFWVAPLMTHAPPPVQDLLRLIME